MQQVIALMPSLTGLPLAPTYLQLPTAGSGAGLQELQPLQLPLCTFPSALASVMLEWNALHYKPPACEAEQTEEVARSPEATFRPTQFAGLLVLGANACLASLCRPRDGHVETVATVCERVAFCL